MVKNDDDDVEVAVTVGATTTTDVTRLTTPLTILPTPPPCKDAALLDFDAEEEDNRKLGRDDLRAVVEVPEHPFSVQDAGDRCIDSCNPRSKALGAD